jgi:glycosyltransferase involved in cell wall biosynthesis
MWMRLSTWLRSAQDHFSSPTRPPELDLAYYRAAYPDLASLTDAELIRHYLRHGKEEGRYGRSDKAQAAVAGKIAQTEGEYGALPDDFNWREYISLHPDLAYASHCEYEATAHYLKHGRQEGRAYYRFDPDLYRELYFFGQAITDEALADHYEAIGRAAGYFRCAADLMASRGLKSRGRWLEALNFDEFRLLNCRVAPHFSRKLDAFAWMLDTGISLMAPIGFQYVFDPVYYRQRRPELLGASDVEAYRFWLFNGLDNDEPGSPAQHLRRLNLPFEEYPQAFDWLVYARKVGLPKDRWVAIDHLVRHGAPGGAPVPVRGLGAAPFLDALASRMHDDRRAISLFSQARRMGGAHPLMLQRLADGFFRQGEWREALTLYESVIRLPDANIWTYCQAARAALKLQQTLQAFQFLADSKEEYGGTVLWRDVLREAIQTEFDAAWEKAQTLYLTRCGAQADAIMTEAVASVANHWSTLDPLGLPIAARSSRPVLILANVDLRQCTHYRVEQKEQIFEAAGIPCIVYKAHEAEDFISALPGAAAAIFYRLPAMPMNVRAIQIARALGVPTYYDVDDLIFDPAEYPEPFETYGGSITPEFYSMLQLGVPLFRAAMALCDYGIASTTALAEHMKPVVRTGQVFVLPNGLDDRNQHLLHAPALRTRRSDDVILFYGSGTKAHNSDFIDLIGRPLVSIMRSRPNVKLMIVGHLTLDSSFDEVRHQIISLGWIGDVSAYWSLLAEADIAVAVLARYATTDAKSEIKWLEAAVMGVPSIVSATARYVETLEHGVDALLASNQEEWGEALHALIDDADLRRRLVANARRKIQANYSLDANAVRLHALLVPAESRLKPAAAGSTAAKARKRILLANIFFPPQTIGGSTRVVRDNLDCFLRSDARDLEFAVVTSDNDARVPYRVRAEDYAGVPVFRISTPQEANMEWRPFNPDLGKIYADLLDMWRPDLIHFHCPQRLTASIIEEALGAGIPYITTLHDAWWLSDYHFLVDMKGRLREPLEALPLEPPFPATLAQSLERRRRLDYLLRCSEEILGVSEAFTNLYRRCGYERAFAVPNGAPPLPPIERRPSPSGRVRIAHIGSQTHHKGYHLVEAALRQSDFENLELVVVEHSRFGGEVRWARWGSTPVRFVGKTKQERMHELYAEFDVLLAPSIWPESFGLVSREALNAGLWVVASDRGAMGDCVTPGTNGWVIDVSTPEGLISALVDINSNPAKYQQPPPPSGLPHRTAEDQGRDLLAIYRSVLDREKARRLPPDFSRRQTTRAALIEAN